MRPRLIPLALLAVSVAGIGVFSQRLGMLDTVAMLLCGAVAGASLAALAARRKGPRRS